MPIGMVRAPVRLAPFGLRPAAPKAHIGERVFATNTFPATKLAYRVELYLGGSWVDVTAYVYVRNAIRITRGRPDGAIQSQPATCSLTVDNRDGRWCSTNPNGAWYGQLRRGTKLRVCVDHGAGLFERFTGLVSELPPRWDVSENDRYVPLQASGVLRRLGRGQLSQSALRRQMLISTAYGYYPMEDGRVTDGLLDAIGNGSPMVASGTTTGTAATNFGTANGIPGSAGLPAVEERQLDWVFATNGASTTEWTMSFVGYFVGSLASTLIIYLVNGNTVQFNFINGYTEVVFNDPAGTTLDSYMEINTPYANWYNGRPHCSVLSVIQSGANIIWTWTLDGATSHVADSFVGTLAAPYRGTFNGPKAAGTKATLGHLAVYNTFAASSVTTIQAAAMNGHPGEQAHVRFARLCAEEGVAATTAATVSQAMGAQSVATLPVLLGECAEADAGELFDGRSGSLILQSIDQRYNLPVALALDHDLGHVAPDFQPTDDDQRIVNYFRASRANGSSVPFEDSTSRMGTDPDIGVGRYDDGRTFNLGADSQLPDRAGWQVHLGTVEGLRFPKLSLNFARNPTLIDAWLGCDVGSRVTLAHPPAGMPPDLIDVIVEGYTETIGPWLWTVDLNCSPYQPYNIGILAADSGDTDPFLGHLDWDSCVLSSALTTTQTTALVATVPLMTTTADDYPFDLLVEGERMTATGVYAYLNANPYFETTASPWTAFGGTVARSTAQFHEGAASLLLTPNGIEGFPDARSENVAGITAGTAYQAQAWVRCVSSRNVTINILWRDAGGAHFSTSSAAVAVTAATWTLLTVSATAPALTAQAQITVSMAATPPATDLLYIDEAMLINPLLQTLTVTRSVNTVVKTHPAGAVVEMHPDSALWLGL